MHIREWTDKQWDAYHKRTVNIGLDFFELLADATEMLAQGKRLNAAERENWKTTVARCKRIIKIECDKI